MNPEKTANSSVQIELTPISNTSTTDYLKWFNDQDVRRYLADSTPSTSEQIKDWLQSLTNNPENLYFGITKFTTHKSIGHVGLKGVTESTHASEIAIVIGEKDYWGRGYGTQAVRKAVEIGFKETSVNTFYAKIVPEHTASIRLFESAGFTLKGNEKGLSIYSISRDDRSKETLGLMIKKISQDDKNATEPILKATGVISNFTCFEQLYAFLAKPSNHLYLANLGGQRRIILERATQQGGDIRVLFSNPAEDGLFIDAIKGYFRPAYLAYNLIQHPPETKGAARRDDLVIDVKTVANMEDPLTRVDYKKCQRLHPNLKYRSFLVRDFLDEWCNMASEKFGYKVTGENDRRFLDLFAGQEGVGGGVAYNGDKIVGISFHVSHPSDPKLAVNIVLKNLRGYQRLGEWLTVEHTKQLQRGGFEKALIGGTEVESQAQFKRKFLKNGSVNTFGSQKIYSNEGFQERENYLRDFWA